MVQDTLEAAFKYNYPMIILFTVVIVTIRLVYLIVKREKFILYKETFMLAFLMYSLILFYVVTFQDQNYGTNNFIPFHEIMRYEFCSRYFIHNVLGNVIMFLPFGFFVSYILKTKRPLAIFIITMITSVSIEVTQLLIGRTFDVDDIILNIFGGMIGYLAYAIGSVISHKLPKFTKSTWFRNIEMLLILIGTIIIYLSTGLWGILR
jgi:glycopeptide antibiotics resistance protein